MLFITIVALSALFVASCAAFFSIKGLITLFSGSSLAIGVMASSLEMGKLVAASFLHTYWKKINFLLKLYLCLAVLVLMGITSLGIFGFLTDAYQVHSARVNTFDTKIASLTLEKNSIDQAILERTDRIKTLTDLRQTQEQRIQTAGNLKAPREQAYKSIAEANEEIQKKEKEVSEARQKATIIDKEISELKISLNTTTDVGSFKFIADALHTDVDTSVQYFIFTLIAVFDPLAVALVLAWNKLIESRTVQKKEEQKVFEETVRKLEPVVEERSVALSEIKKPLTEKILERAPVPLSQPAPLSVEIDEKQVAAESQISDTIYVATDIVSALPIADTSNIQQQHERRKTPGKNDSVITR